MQTNNSKEKVRQLQNKLYLTAKKCDSRRFHALYDKVYRDDVLFEAWKRVKANKGSSGVEGIRIEDIEADKTMVSIRSIIRKCTDNFRTGNKPRCSYISVIGKHLLKYTGQIVGKVWTYSRYSCKVRR